MTRIALIVDRILVLLVGVALLVVGSGALIWNTGLIRLPQIITAPGLADAIDSWWWRWAVAGTGVVCVAVALRWLLAHRPTVGAAAIRVNQSDTPGTLTFDLSAVATAAAKSLEQHPAVRSAKGRVFDDRGDRTVELAVTAAHLTDLGALVEAIDATCAQLACAVGEVPLATRAIIRVQGGRSLTRPNLE